MLIKEACKECKLTKKAIEYYEEQGLVSPQILENGYRDFTADEIGRLKKIAVLRRLGVSVSDIQKILNENDMMTLSDAASKMESEIETLKSKKELLKMLVQNQDWECVQAGVEALERKQTILERLTDAFPGYYGRYISLHFALYLKEPIVTEEQQKAFETILSFLDSVDFKIPAELQEYFDEITKKFDADFAAGVSESMDKAIQNPEKYIADNQEIIENYLAFKQSNEYRQSPAYQIYEVLDKFNRESGYNDIFIPAMKRVSTSYRSYYEAMEKANEVFLKKFQNRGIDEA